MALIRHLPIEPHFEFMARRKLFLIFSAVLVALSVALFFGRGSTSASTSAAAS